MPNYNTQLQSNNIDLESILQSLQDKIAGSGNNNNNNNNNNVGFIATMQIINNKSIVPDVSNYIGDVTMEGEE